MTSRTRSFTIPDDAVAFPFPGIDELVERIPRTRPRAYFTLEAVAEIRGDWARFTWLVDPVVRSAEAVLQREEPLFEEPRPWDEYEDWREGPLAEGSQLVIPVACGAESETVYYVYFDNPSAQTVPD